MCGITGFNWKDDELIRQMNALVAHRGNDQSGVYTDFDVSLGHQRLSVIDLSDNGAQPMCNEDRTVWVVFNGEIYNFLELRNRLIDRGHAFRSQTDTEVIVHAYEEWGEDCVREFRGMFAFAVWDKRKRKLFAARDRVGIKPFYYYWKDGKFAFASELKALLATDIPRTINAQALYHVIGYEFVPGPSTMFEDISKLLPGHLLVVENGRLRVHRYWDLACEPMSGSREQIEEEIVDRLDEAVSSHLRSDVPLGIFLSGGIDSSSILAMMRRHLRGPIRSFSIGYEEKSYSEYEYAKRVSDHFGTIHTEILLPPISPEIVQKSAWHFDEPTTDFSNIPYMMLCQEARKHVTVCLGGDGGDELFAGYDRFRASKINSYFRRLPALLRTGLAQTASLLPDHPEKKNVINMAKRFIEGASLDATGEHLRWQYFLSPQQTRSLFRRDFLNRVFWDPFDPLKSYRMQRTFPTRLDRELYMDFRTIMVDSVLMKVDKMSMASALEVRVPFLDHRFVEFAARIPARLKLEGLTTTSVFKSALAPHLPPGIAYRKKQGFSFPIKHWLRGQLRPFMEDTLFSSDLVRQYFNIGYIHQLVAEHLRETHNHSHILWSLVNLCLWHAQFSTVASDRVENRVEYLEISA